MLTRPFSRGPLGIAVRTLVLVGVWLHVVAAGGRLGAADLEEITAAKVIRVGVIAGENPPFLTGAGGAPLGGLEGDLIGEISRRMDVKVEIVRTARTPEELIAQVVGSKVDLAIGQLTDSLEWAKSVRFTKPYVILQEVRLVDRLAAAQNGGSVALLSAKTARLAAPAGSVVLPAIHEEFGDRLTVTPTLAAALADVISGKAAGAIGDDVAVVRWLNANPASGLRLELSTRKDRRPGLAIAVSWKSDDLQAWLNLCLDKCVLDGTLPALVTKHLGEARAQLNK